MIFFYQRRCRIEIPLAPGQVLLKTACHLKGYDFRVAEIRDEIACAVLSRSLILRVVFCSVGKENFEFRLPAFGIIPDLPRTELFCHVHFNTSFFIWDNPVMPSP